MVDCAKKYNKKINEEKTLAKIEEFCKKLCANKVKDSKELFNELPEVVQCLFLKIGQRILKQVPSDTVVPYIRAYRLFKLFRNKKAYPDVFAAHFTGNEANYKKADAWFKDNKDKDEDVKHKSTGTRGPRKKYDVEGQRKERPESDEDPLYIFYTTMYEENKESPLAITWLVDHGIYTEDKAKRDVLLKKYKTLAEAKHLIK